MLTCVHCQADFSEEEAIKEKISVHLTVRCPYCGKYIMHLQQSDPSPMEELPFGKHKGKTCMRITREDRQYAEWAVRNLKGRYQKCFELALKSST